MVKVTGCLKIPTAVVWNVNHRPAELRFIPLFENTVDPDQKASFSSLFEKNMLTTGMLLVNRIKLAEECST